MARYRLPPELGQLISVMVLKRSNFFIAVVTNSGDHGNGGGSIHIEHTLASSAIDTTSARDALPIAILPTLC